VVGVPAQAGWHQVPPQQQYQQSPPPQMAPPQQVYQTPPPQMAPPQQPPMPPMPQMPPPQMPAPQMPPPQMQPPPIPQQPAPQQMPQQPQQTVAGTPVGPPVPGIAPNAPPPPPVQGNNGPSPMQHEAQQAPPPPTTGGVEEWNQAAEFANAVQQPPMGTRHTVQGQRPVFGHGEGHMQEVRDADGKVYHVPDQLDKGQGVQAQPRYGTMGGHDRSFAAQGERHVSGQVPFGRGYNDMGQVPTAANVNNQYGGGYVHNP